MIKLYFGFLGLFFILLLWLYLGSFFRWSSLNGNFSRYNVDGRHINELIQDTVEKNWGIRNFYESFSSQNPWCDLIIKDPVSKQETRLGYVSWSETIFSITLFGTHYACIQGDRNAGGVLNPLYDGLGRPISSKWNDRLRFYYYPDYKVGLFNLAMFFYVLGPVVCYFFLFLLLLGVRFSRYIVAICTWITFLLWIPFLWSHFPQPRNYSSSYQDTCFLMRENEPVLRRVLSEQPDISLVELPFLKALPMENGDDMLNKTFFPGEAQERNIHNGIGFVSKKPFFPYDYIRVNVDLFNYLFYAPELTEENLVEINPKLTYRSLGDGIWLGQYTAYIMAVFCLKLSYFISYILGAVMCGISIWFLWSDIHGWLKRRKLKKEDI